MKREGTLQRRPKESLYDYATFCNNVSRINGRTCWVCSCLGVADERCGWPLDFHHIVSKEALRKRYPLGCAFPERRVYACPVIVEEAKFVPLTDILQDGRNGIPVGRFHHAMLESGKLKLAREELPPSVEEFAASYGLPGLLDRTYGKPPGGRQDASHGAREGL